MDGTQSFPEIVKIEPIVGRLPAVLAQSLGVTFDGGMHGRFAFGKWQVFEFFLNSNDGIGDIRIATADLHPAPVEAGG